MKKKVYVSYVVVFILIFSMGTTTWGAEPGAFSDWAKDARIAGAFVGVGMTSVEMDAVITKLVNENVSVIEADSELSGYLSDAEFNANLALMNTFATKAHAAGLKVVWYITSLEVVTRNGKNIPNTMYKDHPDWVQLGLNGMPNVFYGSSEFWVGEDDESAWLSPSSPYRDYFYGRVVRIINETDIDGLWIDVPLFSDTAVLWSDTNPLSVAAFAADTGLTVPAAENWEDPVWRRWVSWRHTEIADFLEGLRTAGRNADPQFPLIIETVTLDHNAATSFALEGASFKYSEGMTHVWELDAISDSDSMFYAQEDDWISMIAMNKFARAASGSKPSWIFSKGKDEANAKLIMAEILAAGNNPFESNIPDMISSVGAAFRTKMFGWIKDNSTYLYNRQTAAKVAIFYSQATRDFINRNNGDGIYATTTKPAGVVGWWSVQPDSSAYSQQNLAEYRGMVKLLVHSHIPFDVVVEPDQAELSRYETVILPDVEAVSAAEASLIRQYVQNGGHAIFTGPNPSGLNEFGDVQSNYLLADVLGFSKGQAAVPQNTFGSGEARYFEGLLGKNYFVSSDGASLTQLRTAVLETSTPAITTNADRRVHFELSYSGDNMILQLVNFIGVDGTYADSPTSFDVELAIPVGKQATSVSLTSPDNGTNALQPVAFTPIGQRISFNTSLNAYSMIVVELGSGSNTMPTAVASPDTATNGDVTVTISYGADSTVKQYKVGAAGAYADYTVPVVVSDNDTVYFKGQDSSGVWSPEGSLVIGNIDKIPPAMPTAEAYPEITTSSIITVTINYSADSAVKEYRIGDGAWTAYAAPLAITENGTIYARGTDGVGNVSAEGSIVISNVDADAPAMPAIPTLSAAPAMPTNGAVTVTITYSENSTIKEYRIGSAGTWTPYTEPVVMGANDTIYARGTDDVGNPSAIGSLIIGNIDQEAPVAPTAVASPTALTTGVVTVTITYSVDSAVKQYRMGEGAWTDYTGPIAISSNTTVYAQGIDAAGNISAEGSLVIGNITEETPAPGGGGGGGGGGGSSAPPSGGGGGAPAAPAITITTEETPLSTINTSVIPYIVESGTASATISAEVVDGLLKKAADTGGIAKGDLMGISIDTNEAIEGLEVSIRQSDLERITTGTDSGFSIMSPLVTMTFDGKALEVIVKADSGGLVVMTARVLDPAALSEAEKTKVGDRPVYDLTVMNGDNKVSDFGSGRVTVKIPYTLQQGENPNAVVIYYLADDGSLNTIRGRYDSGARSVVFTTSHFSKFVIGYNRMSFNDVSADAWYKNAVDFIAARGITSGTGENTYGPEVKLTRAQFLVLLMNAYQISTQSSDVQLKNFTDAGDAYYTKYLLAARGLGVVNGMGNDQFAPDKEITRQEMFVMLYNVLKVIDEFPTATVDKAMESFNDAGRVAPWASEALSALVKAGITGGSDNNLNPEASTTRAEMAQILYNLQFE